MGLFRKPRIPQEYAQLQAQIPHGERVMSWAVGPATPQATAEGSGATLVVATDLALYLFGHTDRMPWEHVLRAAWEDPILEVVSANGRGGVELTRVTLDEAGSIPQVVHERVMSTIVMQRHVELRGETGATLVARRVRGSDEIRWEVVFDAGLDPSDPALRAAADEELDALRASVGI